MMKKYLLITFCFIFSFLPRTHAQLNVGESDYLALLEFATIADISGWTTSTNWDFTNPVDATWHGITIDGGRISKIELPNNNIFATAPALGDQLGFFSALNALEVLNLAGNDIGGELADDVFNPTAMEVLNLSSNSNLTKADLSTTNLGNQTALKELNLSQTGIGGNFPTNLNNLTNLEILDVHQANMSGTLDMSDINALTQLKHLNISNNAFTGNLPTGGFSLPNLIELDFSSNKFDGAIDNTLQNSTVLTLLEILNLRNNSFTGDLPTDLSHFSSLRTLDLSRNQLENTIPDTYPANLTELDLQRNRFSALPATFTGLNAIRIDLNHNELSGSIPKSLMEQSKLRTLHLDNNTLTGIFPDITDGVTADNLEELYLNNNQLKFISSDLSTDCPNLEVVQLQHNFLTALPNFASNTALNILQIHDNQLTFDDFTSVSDLPTGINYKYDPQEEVLSSFTTVFTLGQNIFLTADLPADANKYEWYKDTKTNIVQAFSTVSSFSTIATASDAGLYWAEITNPNFPDLILKRSHIIVKVGNSAANVPDSLALVAIYNTSGGTSWKTPWVLTDEVHTWHGVTVDSETGRITAVDLRDNNLSGPLLAPTSAGVLDKVATLDLSNNKLSGGLPADIAKLTGIQNLYLHDNRFSGTLPATTWASLPNLQRLTLSDNRFTNNLPTSLNDLTQLELLYLNNNLFDGTIPDISGLTKLREAYFHNNDFEGNVPDFTSFATALEKLRINNNKFDQLPDLSSITSLNLLQVERNEFTFEDLQPNRFVTTFSYVPQSEVLGAFTTALEYGATIFLTAEIGGTGNNYQWYRDTKNTAVGTNSPFLTIANVVSDDAGVYWAEITNTDLPDLTLQRRQVNATLGAVIADPADKLILLDLYNATKGADWTVPWITVDPVRTWQGVELDSETGKVTRLNLTNNNLDGTALPASLGGLDELRELNLSNNKLAGFIPKELGDLAKLENLFLQENNFAGAIPPELGSGAIKATLIRLDLNDNRLSGNIPVELNQLSNLTLLQLSDNLLTGDLPDITPLTNLKEFQVSGNDLTGAIPNFVAFAPNLEKLKIQNNRFSVLPNLSTLTNLTSLEASYNKLTFNDLIPNIDFFFSTVEYAPQLETMNEFTSSIPFGQSTFLTAALPHSNNEYSWYKDSETNQISPPSLTDKNLPLTSLIFEDAGSYWTIITNTDLPGLTLRRNPINIRVVKVAADATDSLALVALYNSTDGDNWVRTWNLPAEHLKGPVGHPDRIPLREWYGVKLDEISGKILEVSLSDNGLDGTLPTAIGDLSSLRHLDLSNNLLEGNIPTQIGNLTSLINFFLDENELSGSLPSTIGDMTAGTRILLNDNELSGNIPAILGNLNFLTLLHLHNNNLSGAIPPNLANAGELKQLYVYNNKISGDFPVEFMSVTKLERVKLQLNDIENLPDLSSVSTLEVLEVSENKLTFEDLQYNASVFTTVNDYAPQQLVLDSYIETVVYAESAGFDATIGGTDNEYQWYHNSVGVGTQPFLSVASAVFEDAGIYHADITNDDLAGLTIRRNSIVFNVFSTARATLIDSLALVALHDSTDGPNWTQKWNLAQPVAQWYGVTVDDNLGVVVELRLPDNNLRGKIPERLGEMNLLRVLDLSSNYLQDSIPRKLGNLSALVDLFLHENQLKDTIPASFGDLIALRRMFLNDNDLIGKIPPELGKMTNLSTLHVYNNKLSGVLPEEIGSAYNLKEFYLYNNLLEGVIPDSIARLPRLERLKLQDNFFVDLPQFTTVALTQLEVENNFFTFEDLLPNAFVSSFVYSPQAPVLDTLRQGVFYWDTITFNSLIDERIRNNTYTWYKDTQENRISNPQAKLSIRGVVYEDEGLYWTEITNPTLPDLTLVRNPIFFYVNPPGALEADSLALVEFYTQTDSTNWQIRWDLTTPVHTWHGITTDLGRVTEINLEGNNLFGELPVSLSTLEELRVLNLNSNTITGKIPKELEFLTALTELDLSFNLLEGEIPTELMRLSHLTQLILNDNDLIGTIPNSIGALASLQTLNLGQNKLEGQIPESIGWLKKIVNLYLNGNLLEGTIPTSLQDLELLEILNLSDNGLTGNIPSELGNIPRIKVLDISENDLAGNIPPNLGNLSNLTELNVSSNALTGTITTTFGELFKLKSLDLSNNRLTGGIPNFSDLVKLRELILSKNELSGAVPATLVSLGDLRKIQLEGNLFTDLPQFNESLQVLDVQNNLFTFEDLEPNIFVDKYVYAPQAPLDEVEEIEVIWQQKLALNVTDAGGAQTRYQWKKNANPIGEPSTDNHFSIEKVDYSDAGEYTCDVTNHLLPDLIISRRRVVVRVIEPEVTLTDAQVLLKIYDENGGKDWRNTWNRDSTDIKTWYGVTVVNDRVTELDLRNNDLTGKLLEDIKHLTDLEILKLSGNQFEGTIPKEIGNLLRLTELDLANNLLEGEIPAEIGNLGSLEKLFLQGNQFGETVTIPDALSNLKSLQEMDLSDNGLSGIVPQNFVDLPRLTKLILNNNNLREVPDFSSHPLLAELQVVQNYLTFRSLVPNRAINTFRYAPQKDREVQSLQIEEGDKLSLVLSDSTIEERNNYQWFKGDNDISNSISSYQIESTRAEDTGEYECIVTNPELPQLTLEYTFVVDVTPRSPSLIVPLPYCISDSLVILTSESPDTDWYADSELQDYLGTGQKLRISVTEAQKNIYAVINISGNISKVIEAEIIRKPVIRLEGGQLITDEGDNIAYEWYKDGVKMTGENSNQMNIQGDGGEYKVTVITDAGCSATSSVYRLENGELIIVNENTQITGNEEFNIISSIYPNPYSEGFEVRFNRNYGQEVFVKITDAIGRIQLEKTLIGNAGFILRTPHLSRGVYFLTIQVGKRKMVRKIIKK